ncbi:MAG TPA: hypothetical protein HPQ00_15695, partial [Magnetococcales bacterium]|nr:hypothetical protein [Magnetococcales bacterium]
AGDPGREALFTTHYQRPKPVEGGVQMDLFLDTPETMLINDLLQAIVKHDVPTSTDLFKRLEKEHARNGMLEEFRPLLGAITRGKTLVEDPMGGLELLQGEITPCARQSLGRLEDLFLKPFYRIFDHAFVGKAFDPKHPEAHRSWTLERLEDWKSVGECVLLEEDWMQQPVLLFRRAHALFRLRRLDSSRQVWILFFWKFPRQAAQVLEAGGDKDLMRWWHGFTDWTADKEVDYDLFPAWMLLDQPKLAENRAEWSEETDKTIPGRKAFFLLADLLDAEKETPFSPDSMKLRRKLKKAFPELFTLFMQTRRQGPP